MSRHPPNREQSITDPHKRFLLGKIEEKGDETDLASIRRPSYFARAPYHEPIAADDEQTYIVEFTAPAEAYERLHLHVDSDVKLRGWYIRGTGVDDGKGHKVRTLVTVSGGGGDRVTAIDDPSDAEYHQDPGTGVTVLNDYPNATTGAKGMAAWRGVVHELHQAGFDVLEFDRRGIGISSGNCETYTLQQGHDLLDIIASLRTGKSMRALTPNGKVLSGPEAAAAVRGNLGDAGMPVFLLGTSRGTMASSWAMTINFDKDCSYDLPGD